MDWLDQYLHELHRPGAVMHFPPDKQSWHAPVPSKQQLSLIQDATVADMVRMRMIQEARQMEIDAGMGGGYDAGSAARERPATPAAPVGIPVASTASVTISNYTPHPHILADNAQFFTANTTYTKRNNLQLFNGYNNEIRSNGGLCYSSAGAYDVAIILPPNVSLETVNAGTFYDGVNKWRMAGHVHDDGNYIGLGFYAAGSEYETDQYILQNDSTDITQIPTSGWYVFDRSTNTNLGASSITITAA